MALIKKSVIIVTDLHVPCSIWLKIIYVRRETCAFVHNISVLLDITIGLVCVSARAQPEWGLVGNCTIV